MGDGNSRLLGAILKELDYIKHLARDIGWVVLSVYGVDGLSSEQMQALKLSKKSIL